MAKKCYRKNVGIMVLNAEGKVFIAHRTDNRDKAWQMPQGGIDDGENAYDAALRELCEETGISSVSLIAESKNWYAYDFPNGVKFSSKKKKEYIGQTQKWFLFEFTGDEKEIDIHQKHAEFDDWQWTEVENVIELIVSFKKEVYEAVVEDFLPFIEVIKLKA